MENKSAMWKIIGASNHTDEERQTDDYYATDPIAVDKLLAVEKPNHRVWECACGGGHLSKRLQEKGFWVYSTDIVDRGYCDEIVDFLKEEPVYGISAKPLYDSHDITYDILTNPPYKYAMEFVLRALELLQFGCKCYMFLKLTFLESEKRYKEIFEKTPPKTIYVFSKRVLCAKNAEFERMKEGGGSAVAYGWFVWEKGYKGTTQVEWI